MHIFELPCAIDVILVSSHSLECQLSFDTLLYMFIVCTTGVIVRLCVFGSLLNLYRSQKVRSEVAPYCKLTFVMKTNYVCAKFHAFIQSAQKTFF